MLRFNGTSKSAICFEMHFDIQRHLEERSVVAYGNAVACLSAAWKRRRNNQSTFEQLFSPVLEQLFNVKCTKSSKAQKGGHIGMDPVMIAF